jgi:phosphoglycerate dehydrogenase-like enzyme
MNVLLFRDLSVEQVNRLEHEFPGLSFRQTTRKEEIVSDWAEVIFGNPPVEALLRTSRLRWLQIVSSGFDEYTALGNTSIQVTTAHGVHAPIIAQHALATILWFARGQPHLAERQRAHVWDRRPAIPQDLARQTVGLIGYGEIGRALARMLAPIGPRVIAVKREGTTRPAELAELWTLDRLDELLATSDHVVMTLPLTAQTRGLLDAARLAKMKRGVVLHNVARGGLVDEAALLARIQDGSLGGAALDVFAQEPLAAESPWWDLPNVVVTPHLAGHHRDLGIPTLERFRTNLRRYVDGQPLEHVANFRRGY